ncbi:NADH-quinone oxidoreductase subunit NuoN [Paroceanicella profunda]|uniref:NADH-quinone oxidoreductase subunit N n=1 Tax=Paroceanicella profunda TaxID=2579971 RepID=A0A5B8G1M1_9RHOB|nr:NADH-quinone oxidoreductase subunit NuoN [Paroceanicella profunda]QDL92992.1 NADH-quinone oxidoreductase subunit NuoN [Paroceanicella profunda]
MIGTDIQVILPELALAIYAIAALMWGVFRSKDGETSLLIWATAGVMALIALWIGFSAPGKEVAFHGGFVNDGFARFSKVTLLLGGAAVLGMSSDYFRRRDLLRFEFPVLVALSTVGMMMMVSAGDLIALYMGLELSSLALYVIAAIRRDSLRSTEAGLKYFVLGALSSGLLLYGASLVYGYSGATEFTSIASVVDAEGLGLGLLFGIVFMCCGMAFKISAAPFHMWTPDVYEGAPTPVTAFLATAPKVAAAAMFARLLFAAFGDAVADWQQILAFLAVVSMLLGAVAALTQTNIKRLMAYSSISHMGYALVGLSAGTQSGVEALLIYLAIYVTTNVGVFAFILNMERDGVPVTDLRSLSGYARLEPGRAMALMLLMFSLAGIPPMVGFFGKWYVFVAAVDAGLAWLAVIGAISSVIGAFYYLRIVYLMYFGADDTRLSGSIPFSHAVFLGLSAGAMTVGWLPVINLFGVETLATAAAATLLN